MLGERPSFTGDQEHQRLVSALRESEILRELAELLASSLDLNNVLKVLTKRTAEVCEVERCSVWLVEDGHAVFRPAVYYLSSQRIDQKKMSAADHLWYHGSFRFQEPIIPRLLQEKGILVVNDLHDHPKVRHFADTFLVSSILLIALKREDRMLGMLTLDNPALKCSFSLEQQQLASAIGQQASLAIDNAHLYQQAQAERTRAERLIERARAIYQVALTVNSEENLSAVLKIAAQHLVRGLNADGGEIVLLDADKLRLPDTAEQELIHQASAVEATFTLGDLPNFQQTALTGSPRYVTAKQASESERQVFRKLGFSSAMVVPLMTGSNHSTSPTQNTHTVPQCNGFAFVNYQNPGFHPGKGQFAFAQDIAAQCALAVEKDRLLNDVHAAAALATERANTLDAVFQAMSEGITVLNQDGEVLVRNQAASQFLGIPINSTDRLQAFLQRYPTRTLHGQPLSEEEFPLTRALKGERIRGECFVTTRGDGLERVIEVNVTHMLDDSQQQIGLVSAFRDITEQARAEQRIRKALETMLNVAEAVSGITEIKDILQSVLGMTLSTLNCERGSVYLYDQHEQAFTLLLSGGFEDEEAEKEWLLEQSLWLSPGDNEYQELHDQILEGHATVINAEQYSLQLNPLSQTGTLAAPITHNHHILGLMIVDRRLSSQTTSTTHRNARRQSRPPEFSIWDMAVIEGIAQLTGLAIEQARWQEEAVKARTNEAAMREANALKDEFLAITAHEFRSPLTVILTHSQVGLRALRKGTELQTIQRVHDNLTAIEEQAHQLTNIVNTFLEVTQINRKQLVIKSEPIDLAKVAKHVIAAHSENSTNHQVSCHIASSDHPYIVIGDEARLKQVFANLIQNAMKYSPLGGPVTLSLCQHEDIDGNGRRTIQVCVEDTGIGIPTDALPRLFERFYRGSNIDGNRTRGIGLGLYIVAELIHMHGGVIHAESDGIPGQGSRFIITLPSSPIESETVDSD
jgi:PAS domain S-box-containing protein